MSIFQFLDRFYFLGTGVAVIFLFVLIRVSYYAKAFTPLPVTKPIFCLLPKYLVMIAVKASQPSLDDLQSHLTSHQFRLKNSDAEAIRFSRGPSVDDSSGTIKKMTATATLPLSNPVQLKVEYDFVLGCVFDTGDLWTFCRDLIQGSEVVNEDKIEAGDQPGINSTRVETGNPYQSPLN